MRADGQIFGMQLEEIAAATTTPAARSRLYSDISDTADARPMFYDGTGWVALAKKKKRYATFTSADTILPATEIQFVDATAGAFNVTLPATSAYTGQILRVFKTDTTFSQVTLVRAGSDTVDGTTSIKLSSYREWVDLMAVGTAWTIVGYGFHTGQVAFTPTGSWVANSTYTGFWWRTGNLFNCTVNVALAGAPTSASLTITIPVTMDLTKIPGTATAGKTPFAGRVTLSDTGTDNYDAGSYYGSATTLAIKKDDGDGTISDVTQAAPYTFANTDFVSVIAMGIPVSGWRA